MLASTSTDFIPVLSHSYYLVQFLLGQTWGPRYPPARKQYGNVQAKEDVSINEVPMTFSACFVLREVGTEAKASH